MTERTLAILVTFFQRSRLHISRSCLLKDYALITLLAREGSELGVIICRLTTLKLVSLGQLNESNIATDILFFPPLAYVLSVHIDPQHISKEEYLSILYWFYFIRQ